MPNPCGTVTVFPGPFDQGGISYDLTKGGITHHHKSKKGFR